MSKPERTQGRCSAAICRAVWTSPCGHEVRGHMCPAATPGKNKPLSQHVKQKAQSQHNQQGVNSFHVRGGLCSCTAIFEYTSSRACTKNPPYASGSTRYTAPTAHCLPRFRRVFALDARVHCSCLVLHLAAAGHRGNLASTGEEIFFWLRRHVWGGYPHPRPHPRCPTRAQGAGPRCGGPIHSAAQCLSQ